MKLPFARTWWIEPGKIMGGRFPGTRDPAESRQMLSDLLEAGVRVILNLQEAEELGAGGEPFHDYRPVLLKVAAEQGVQVECHRFPIRDCDVPPPEVMASIQNVLRSASDSGKLVYVHCWGGTDGRARSPGAGW